VRGKAAAKSANRRAQHVLQRAEAAEAALAAERSQNRERQANLEIEIQALRFELDQRAGQIATERVATAIDTIQTQLSMLREEHRLAALKALRIVYGVAGPVEFEQIAGLLGVSTTEIMANELAARKGVPSRPVKRRIANFSKRHARTMATAADQDVILGRVGTVAVEEEQRRLAEWRNLNNEG
jgi:hypothetical protein